MKKSFETLKSHKYFNYIKLGLFLIGIFFLLDFSLNMVSAKIIIDPSDDPPPITYYTISTSVGANGSISPTSASVAYGNKATFTLYPNSGYTGTLSNCAANNISGNIWETGAVAANCTVTATFTRIPAALPVINYFRANPPMVNKGGTTSLEWSVSGATSCSVTGPNVNQTGTLNNSTTPPIDIPTTYTLSCTNGDTNIGSTDICQGTVTGSKVWELACYPEGSGTLNPSPYYCYVPRPTLSLISD